MRTKLASFFFVLISVISCQTKKRDSEEQSKELQGVGIYEDQIRRMEKLIPNSVFNSDHVAIWRSGSIYYSEYLSVLIIEKKQLDDKQILCYYLSFDSEKPSNFRDWKYSTIYELTLENHPFKFPLNDQIRIKDLDTLNYTYGEGIEANNYFITDFESDIIYPISKRYNSKFIKSISKLFAQISAREKLQTLALTKDSISYSEIGKIMKGPDDDYAIKTDRDVNSLQRRYGDK